MASFLFERRIHMGNWSYTKVDDKQAKHKVILIASNKCIVCGKPLQLGRFAHNQNTCWNCFKMKIKSIVKEFNKQSDKDLINYMGAVLAEQFGEEW